MHTLEWAIEDVSTAHPGLYLDHCAVMAVALMSRYAGPPGEFLVECEGFSPPDLEGETSFRLQITWDNDLELQAAGVWRAEQTKPVVERAAVALAALAFARLIPNGEMRVTVEGDRADYWLPRLRRALEISGTEQAHEVPRRHRKKTRQMLANPLGWDGYVFICCFAVTQRLIHWSYHTQQEQDNAP